MRRRMMFLVAVGAVLGLVGGAALATPVINATAETARGPLVDRPLAVNWKFAPGNRSSSRRRATWRSPSSGSSSSRGERWAGTATPARPWSRCVREP
jgi:hypothetical protein